MANLGQRAALLLVVLAGACLVGCRGSSSSCPAGNGKMCDIFSFPVKLRQDAPRLHFTSGQVVEGACEPPRCVDADCTVLLFVGLYYQLEVTNAPEAASPPDTRCRFQISSTEGESFDLLLSLEGSSSTSFCCSTGLRTFAGYSWAASVNGFPLEQDFMGYLLPPSLLDGGVASLDAVTP